jgi:hypothetical protein
MESSLIMRPFRRVGCSMHILRVCSVVLAASVFAFLQHPAPAAQTPRQALIEMITGGEQGITRHLTIEVQQAFKKPGNAQAATVFVGEVKGMHAVAGQALQTFDSGPVLLAFNEPAQHKKFEVHIDNDDLSGEEDNLDLSLHSFIDGQEQTEEWQFLASHFTVSMKQQQGVWRLNKISIGAELPVGDAAFIEKMFGKTPETSGASGGHTSISLSFKPDEATQGMLPEHVVAMLGMAESTFARMHPDTGFTCSLSELAEASQMMGVDQQVNTGTYSEYKFALSGCEGKPAGSFRITAEPVVTKPGTKAFCTDATQNLRVSDDGHGTTCLAAGKVQRDEENEGGLIGFKVPTGQAKPTK